MTYPGQVRQTLTYEYNHPTKWQFRRTYQLHEPVAMGYNDPPEMIGLGDGGSPQMFMPPEAFVYLAVSYLRLHGFLVVPEEKVTISLVET